MLTSTDNTPFRALRTPLVYKTHQTTNWELQPTTGYNEDMPYFMYHKKNQNFLRQM